MPPVYKNRSPVEVGRGGDDNLVVKVVGGVYGKEYGNNRGMFESFWVPIKVVVTGGDGVEGGTKSGNMNQVSTGPVLLETPENIIV